MCVSELMRRLRECWGHLQDGDRLYDAEALRLVRRLRGLERSARGQAVRLAIAKVQADRSFGPKDDQKKRAEVRHWTEVYLSDPVPQPKRAWETNFLLEWWLGRLAGKL